MGTQKGDTSAYISYWHQCLIDASQLDLSQNTAFSVAREEMVKGVISDQKVLEALIAFSSKEEKKAARFDKSKRGIQTDPIKVVISYAMLVPGYSHGIQQKSKAVSLVNLPATIDRKTGELTPDGAPFICRDLLGPSGLTQASEALLIGDIADVDSYLSNHYDDELKEWDEYIAFSSGLLSKVTNTSSSPEKIVVSFDGYIVSPNVEMRYNNGVSGAIFHLNNLYKSLHHTGKKNTHGKLLETLTSSHPSPRQNDDLRRFTLSELHSGSMANGYPNSERQRIAIHHALNDSDGGILAVNGPPGTGKTTLLQGVVASYWVNAALDKQNRPPLIVASSTNNQAVTNIIDSFTNALTDPTVYWRSDKYKSLGLYLCSKSKAGEVAKKSYIYGSRGDSQLSNESELKLTGSFDTQIQAKETLKEETVLFLQKAESASLKEAVNKLHSKLTAQHGAYIALIDMISSCCQLGGVKLEFTFADIKARQTKLQQKKTILINQIEGLEIAQHKLKTAVIKTPIWMSLLSFIPFIRTQRRYLLSQAFDDIPNIEQSELKVFMGAKLENLDDIDGVLALIDQKMNGLNDELTIVAGSISDLNSLIEFFSDSDGTESLLDAVNKKCDCELRYDMFITALRYWTGRFLEEANKLGDTPENCKNIWTRYAMITPCFVSTLHSLPGFFGKGNTWGGNEGRAVIDLLIIDEAGQVSPEVGAPAFAMAKKALVVGDIKQIEPVWGVNVMSDIGNFRSVDLSDFDAHIPAGMLASNGSVMKMALNSCHLETVIDGNKQKGLMLTDHYRCQERIISYCNELAYNGMLNPKTVHLELKYPKMAYVNCLSSSSSSNGSRINQGAAEAAIQWILDNQDFIINEYGSNGTVESLVAIVTPFKAMAVRVAEEASKQGIKTGGEGMTIGTVHSLQGAEREIILFLPTYGGSNDANMSFINRSVNMLNVAVSRAKKHFIVIGDITLFQQGEKGRPSTLLYDYLSPWKPNKS